MIRIIVLKISTFLKNNKILKIKYLFKKFNYQLFINSTSNHKYFLKLQYTYNTKHTLKI